MSPQQQHYSMPFWDFIQSLDPNQGTGRGVDHTAPPPHPPFPPFGAGFPFGGPGHHGAHPPPPGPPGAHPPPPPYGQGFEYGPWFHGGMGGPWDHSDRRHHHHGRGHRGAMNEGEPSGEDDWISASDVEREAERHVERHVDVEKRDSPDTVPADAPDPEEVAPEDDDAPRHPRFGCRGGRGGPGGPGGRGGRGGPWGGPWGGRGGRGGCGGRGGRGGRGGFFGSRHGHPPYPGFPFDFAGLMRGWVNHPLMRNIRDHAQHFQEAYGAGNNDDDSFTPPVDIFDTERAYILHVSLPGAKKEDIGVNWDADRSVLNIAGVVHRPGDEEFISTLASGERKVGMFERNVTLPPEGSDRPDEVDGSGITAKMEDGILVITVPKVEKEWTEIRKVDIE